MNLLQIVTSNKDSEAYSVGLITTPKLTSQRKCNCLNKGTFC